MIWLWLIGLVAAFIMGAGCSYLFVMCMLDSIERKHGPNVPRHEPGFIEREFTRTF